MNLRPVTTVFQLRDSIVLNGMERKVSKVKMQEFGWRLWWRICDYPGEQSRILDVLS